MNVLLDENFPLGLVRVLEADGLRVDHIITLGWRGASDARIRQRLADREVIFLTQDDDFLSGPEVAATVVVSRVRQARPIDDRIQVWRGYACSMGGRSTRRLTANMRFSPRRTGISRVRSSRRGASHRWSRKMLKDVVAVQPLSDHRLRVTFDDRVEGIIHVRELVQFTGVFQALQDATFFVFADFGDAMSLEMSLAQRLRRAVLANSSRGTAIRPPFDAAND